ncbi:MAG: DUF933 domain-containing protein [Candidatus Kapaibacteriales bacterium]
MKIGIVGLPYVGKTTLFHSVSFDSVENIDDSKKKSNLAVIKVPDERLDFLSGIFKPKKKVNATIEIEDFMGSSNPEIQTYNLKFSIKAKTYDAFILVARAFKDLNDPSLHENINPIDEIQQFFVDTMIFDLSFLETRLEKLDKELQKQKNRDRIISEKNILMNWHNALQNGKQLRELTYSPEEELLQKNYQLLTRKPLIVAINFSESDIPSSNQIIEGIQKAITDRKIPITPYFAKIELELTELEITERTEYMQELGIKETALQRLIRSSYEILGLQSFFTVGEDECRAWTIRKGITAQEAGGVIHTDFYNKFIRAEVVSFEDFRKFGSFQKCKEKGVFRLEGKDYIVQDGDIMHIRHN